MKSFFLWLMLPCLALASDVVDRLQDISVTIKSGYSTGSGILFTRKAGDQCRTFVWTAAHVVDDRRSTREIIVGGDKKTVIEFKDVAVVREFTQDGRRIGEQNFDARVIKYSDSDTGEDLALLEIRKRDYVPDTVSVEFYDGPIPPLGTELYHVGSMLGQIGANSLTSGVMSQHGRVLSDLGADGKVFDQVTCAARPGSSGSGVFIKESGKCIGMLVRGSGETFNLIVPVRRMRHWAEEQNIMWAVDKDVAMPSDEEMGKMPIEEASPSAKKDKEPDLAAGSCSLDFPTLIQTNGPIHLIPSYRLDPQ